MDLDVDIHMRTLKDIPEYLYEVREIYPKNQYSDIYQGRKIYLEQLVAYFK
ncbi:hypothetical protein ACOBV9_08680 [Pseudoalteromonas espejiana]